MGSTDQGERASGDVYATQGDPEHSRWIHRDKLARIENEELQAAGIILPRSRATSKASRREHSRDQQGSGHRSEQAQKRQRVESFPTEEEEEQENLNWDLRLPDEAAEDLEEGFQDISGGVRGVSRIPVSKSSPIPIPVEHLERDTPIRRKPSELWVGEEEVISNPKTRGRSESIKVLDDSPVTPTPAKRAVSGTSPKKAARKGSTPSTTRATSAQRPKTRSGSGRDAAARPPTRSGEASSKRPEGDPPWLASMYKPDPRLPPDQQLLPTVAKRLQQEQWKKEGKVASVYDTSFEPLNDDGFPAAPGPTHEPHDLPEPKPEEQNPEWPLRSSKSPTLSSGRPGTAGGYSTMPKISSAPPPRRGAELPRRDAGAGAPGGCEEGGLRVLCGDVRRGGLYSDAATFLLCTTKLFTTCFILTRLTGVPAERFHQHLLVPAPRPLAGSPRHRAQIVSFAVSF